MSKTIEYTSIEIVHDSYWYCQHGVYGSDSVLAGQDFRQLVSHYDSLELAVQAHPEARVDLQGYKPENYMPDCAPDWFDPLYAGESWREEE